MPQTPARKQAEERRNAILEFIQDNYQQNNIGTTYTEIVKATGLSLSVVRHHVMTLQRLGKISRHSRKSRSIIPLYHS